MRKSFYVNLYPMHSGVTGSCFHMKAVFPSGNTYALLIDCGMFQEKEYSALNEERMPNMLRTSECLLITHNHIDHMGKVPELIRNDFRGQIYCSVPTSNLLEKSWIDCQKIEETTAARLKRYPRFKPSHVTEATRRINPCKYGEKIQIHPNISITFFMNGHVYGSSIILIEINSCCTDEPPINFLFTGDYNSKNAFFNIEPLPHNIKDMPLHIICESTYGANERQHCKQEVFVDNILRQIGQGKDILIPTFAFERGQLILSTVRKLQEKQLLDLNIPIYIDGKLLRKYTKHYIQVAEEYFVDSMQEIMPFNYKWVEKISQRESIVNDGVSKIIITTAGMGSYGPAQFYIPLFVTNPNGVIHFTGYQCEGTIGRNLQVANETGELAEIYGRLMDVKSLVYHTSEFSSHASQSELIQFLAQFLNAKSISLNHGSYEAKQDLAKRIISEGMAKDVPILARGNMYRYDAYKLIKIVEVTFD